MAAYAAAWTGDSPLAADAVTASPYPGFGSLKPLLDSAAARGRGVFVLAATSNPEGASVQRADAGGRSVAQLIIDQAAAVNYAIGPRPRFGGRRSRRDGDRGARRQRARRTGAGTRRSRFQGGRPDALSGLGGAAPGQLLPAVSRDVLRAGPDVAMVRAAGERMRDAVAYLAG